MNAFFLPLATLQEWCERRCGDAENFGIIYPGGETLLENWPIAADGQGGMQVVLSLQERLDDAEEKFPDHSADELVVFLELEGNEDSKCLSFILLKKEVVEKMVAESLQ